MNVLLLCDYRKDIAATVVDHIDAICRGSRHDVRMVSMLGDLPARLELARFDAVIIHYTLTMSEAVYMSADTRRKLSEFRGLKAAFIQDEYRFVNRTIAAMREIGVELLFTCVPEGQIEKVYPESMLPGVTKVNVLTGYVPEALRGSSVRPYASRPIDVGYRSRDVPEWLGEMGLEKTVIGRKFSEDAGHYGLVVDSSTREADRLYGEDWIRFISSCKAVLGVESGASVFDFTGEIQANVEAHKLRDPDVSFEKLQALYFKDKEGLIDLRQISPRCFEAASLGTLMVLYEGHYSGVLVPWRHYVPLRKDHSNMSEVVAAIRDVERAERIIDHARTEVALDERWSYRTFARRVDEALGACFEPRHASKLRGYTQFELDHLLLGHRVMMALSHQKRRAIGWLAGFADRTIRTCVPRPYQQPAKRFLRQTYERVGWLLGRRVV